MKDQPLKASIEGDELVIRIGIDTLAFAATHCPIFDTPPNIMNNRTLAHDVVSALRSEEEDGSTRLSDMLDEALLAAYEDGGEGFEPD